MTRTVRMRTDSDVISGLRSVSTSAVSLSVQVMTGMPAPRLLMPLSLSSQIPTPGESGIGTIKSIPSTSEKKQQILHTCVLYFAF